MLEGGGCVDLGRSLGSTVNYQLDKLQSLAVFQCCWLEF